MSGERRLSFAEWIRARISYTSSL